MTPADCIPVSLADHSYDVVIGPQLLAAAGPRIRPFCPRGRTFLVSDTTVASQYGAALMASLSAEGITCDQLLLPPGEAAKDFATLHQLMSALADANIERTDCIIALGGGVIGDLTGFAAAILRRGTAFVQMPTTLLAQVDSSVGGKTAINLAQGKNLVGAFHQPVLVLADTDVLRTLPARELRAGYAEVIKYGLIGDAPFFAWCETNGAALLAGDSAAQRHAIVTSVRAKADIVARDPRETNGTRALLNLGHTFGHALEAELKYATQLLHGEAVAIGMQLAFDFSVQQGLCPAADADRLRQHLQSVELPTGFRQYTNATGASLIAHMRQDKKRQSGNLPFLLARGIGQTYLDRSVDLARIELFLDAQVD